MTFGRISISPQRGITLIEMLLVVVILGLGVSMSASALSRVADDAVRSTLPYRWRAFDTNARILARRSARAVMLERDVNSGAITAHPAVLEPFHVESNAHVLRFDYAADRIVNDVRLFASTDRYPVEAVLIDRTGTSADYDVEFALTRPDMRMSPQLVHVRVHGMTGMVEETE